MADFIEGKRPVIEALRTGVPIKSILMADNVQRDGLIEDILRKAKRAGATVEMVPRLVMEHCDFLVKLPIEGEVASLNVAQAATACMYEWLRQNQ